MAGAPGNIEASSAAAQADLEAQFGSGTTPEDPGEAAIHARFRNRQPAPATPPGPEAHRENPFAGMFRGAMSGVRDNLGRAAGVLIGLKDRLPSVSPEQGQKMAEQFTQRASSTLAFGRPVLEFVKGSARSAWESKTEIGVGMAAGAVTKEAAKFAASFFLPGGILVRAGAGALAGAASAAAKETVSGVRGYNQFKADLDARLKNALSQEATIQAPKVRAEFFRREYLSLQVQIATETDSRKKEALADHQRYLGYFIRKQDWQGANRATTPQQALNEFLAYSRDNLDPTSLSSLKQEILRSERVDKTRLRKKIMRGAAFGAAGGILGGILVDWISSSLEAAPAPMPAAAPAETPAAAPEPTATAEPTTTATATAEPTSTPRPAPTATPEPPRPTAIVVPAEATPAPVAPSVPVSPAEAPIAGGPAAPSAPAPEAPQATAAAPAPAAPVEQVPAATTAPTAPEPLPPTTAPTGVEVQGSTIDNSLTYGGRPWIIVDNGVKNIGNLFNAVGESGDIDKQALATSLQKATALWAQGNLSPTTDPDLYKIFHLSNGTSSMYNNLLQSDTLESLKKLGIVIKK